VTRRQAYTLASASFIGRPTRARPISTDSKCFEVISAAVWGRQLPEIRAQEKGLIAHCQGTWQLESYATEPAYSSNDIR
jgi:hypothetical protein